MSLLTELSSRSFTRFRGTDQLSDAASRSGGILSRNVEYVTTGPVQARRGIAELWNPSEAIRSLMHWIQADWDRLMYFIPDATNGGSVKSRNLDLGTTDVVLNQLLATNAVGAVFSAFGSRVLIASFKADSDGSNQGWIWNGLFSPLAQVDKLFQGALVETTDFTFTLAEPVAGGITAGDHKVGIVWRTRNAFETKPTVAAATFTATGGNNLRITLTPVGNWPDWTESVRVILTTVNNPDLFYFVPDVRETVNPGTSTPVVINVDIADVTLALGDEATKQFDLFTQTAGAGPFDPFFITTYGNRAVYLTNIIDTDVLARATSIFISDPARPQVITADRHQLQLPEKRLAACAFVLHSTLYVTGPQGTFGFDDNTQAPVTWAAATLIDGRIGATSPHGVDTNTSRTRAWIASPHGLYAFKGGNFPALPTSHLQTADWDRINWAVAASGVVQVIDDSDEQTVRVLAPLDGATLPTHILTWNYRHGDAWNEAGYYYSLDDFDPLTNIGALATIINPTKKINEYLLANAAAGKVYRQKSVAAGDGTSQNDSALYSDDGLAIDAIYRSQSLPAVSTVKVQHGGDQIRLLGNGRLKLSILDFDLKNTIRLDDVEHAESAPGEFIQRKYQINSESAHLEVTNDNVAGSWFRLAALKHYFRSWIGES